MSLLRKTDLYQSLLAGTVIVLTATLSVRAVEVDRTPILIPNIQEPEEMRVAPFSNARYRLDTRRPCA
jgi:hypothetical protein